MCPYSCFPTFPFQESKRKFAISGVQIHSNTYHSRVVSNHYFCTSQLPFFSNTSGFPGVSGGFLERRIPGKNGGGTPKIDRFVGRGGVLAQTREMHVNLSGFVRASVQDPLIHKCVREPSWQRSARGLVNANTCKHMATGQNPVPPLNILIPTNIKPKMGGASTPIPKNGIPKQF